MLCYIALHLPYIAFYCSSADCAVHFKLLPRVQLKYLISGGSAR